MAKHGLAQASFDSASTTPARLQRRRAVRLLRRGDERKALQLLRESAALEPSGASYCWLADALLRAGKQDDALHALRQALYCYRHDHLRGRASTVARWILRIDPSDAGARRTHERSRRTPLRRAA